MEWDSHGDRLKLATWAVDTWTMDELREHVIMSRAALYFHDWGLFEQDLNLMKAEQEEE